jgi:large subunit ribosomal protein L11
LQTQALGVNIYSRNASHTRALCMLVVGIVIIPLTTARTIYKKEEERHVRKKIAKVVKLELSGGEAKPGPKLASAGIVMPKFCTDFNAKTADRRGKVVPVIITAYEDKSFDFEIKTTPVAILLKEAAGNLSKGSDNAKAKKVGKITKAQLREIAEYKMPDLNAIDIEGAMKIVAGSARNMGIVVED